MDRIKLQSLQSIPQGYSHVKLAIDVQGLVHFLAFNKHMFKELHEGNAINRNKLIPVLNEPGEFPAVVGRCRVIDTIHT